MAKVISFVRGFRVPKQKDIDAALGTDASFSNEFKATFASLPTPTHEADWLVNYKERGQTYAEFLDDCPFLDGDDDPVRKYIYLTLLDDDDRLSVLNINHLIDYTQRFFQMEVKLLPLFTNINWNETKRSWICTTKGRNDLIRETKLRTRHDKISGHSQICVNNILTLLKRSIPTDACYLVAITLHDFYSDESDLFIAGLAEGNARVAAFSFFRYDPRLTFGSEFWYDWKIKETKSLSIPQIILLRSCRLLTHEIGHLFGIDHCIYYNCLMNGSGHLDEDFSQPLFLCPIDLRKLSQLSKSDFVQRYEQLLEFCITHQFDEEINILKKRLEILKNNQSIKKNKNSNSNESTRKTKRRKNNR
ncbi:hypothetical protein I4U23_018999 [Adineta vaga]|nr:hypothetical protein I4U23_018999 [Adineta vaga]